VLVHPWDAPLDDEEWRSWLLRHDFGQLIAPGDGRDLPIVVPHERTGLPSRCTVHAPHCCCPQPNFVPVRPSVSRSTQSSGMSSGASTRWRLPFSVNSVGMR